MITSSNLLINKKKESLLEGCEDNLALEQLNAGSDFSSDLLIDDIVALATPVGVAGVAVIRVSGIKKNILNLFTLITKKSICALKPRYAYYTNFYNNKNEILDKGIVLYFSGPNSYTGEDVLELHCHGGSVVVDRIISEILRNKVRMAEPGEFTKRAWLNGKMDLAQVEAVSDLINATSEQAANSAINTLNGEFSKIINQFLGELVSLRVYVEAAIDFSDQEIDFIADGQVFAKLNELKNKIAQILDEAKQGVILQEGINIAIAGEPNAGKSSLLNALCRKEEAIVTSIPGTTRDVIKTNLNIKGVPISLVDTAGLRETEDIVEKEGIKRAYDNIASSDLILLVVDSSLYFDKKIDFDDNLHGNKVYTDLISKYRDKLCVVFNKIDKLPENCDESNWSKDLQKINLNSVFVSAKEKIGVNVLEDFILRKVGYKQTNEGKFIARRRHLESLNKVEQTLFCAESYLQAKESLDLVAEELRNAQVYLGEITGEFTPDELLGNIFSSFCIGK